MTETKRENLTLENYENEFLYKENKSNLNISFNRIAFIFFIFIMICFIYSLKVFYLGSLNLKLQPKKIEYIKQNSRADIVDNNGDFIAKSVNTLTVGINPNLIINKKKYFRLEKELSQIQIEKLRLLGDKSIKFEELLTRIYPQKNLFSHILGQIDDDNNGISGIEKFFDYELKKRTDSLKLTVDTDIQFLIRE